MVLSTFTEDNYYEPLSISTMRGGIFVYTSNPIGHTSVFSVYCDIVDPATPFSNPTIYSTVSTGFLSIVHPPLDCGIYPKLNKKPTPSSPVLFEYDYKQISGSTLYQGRNSIDVSYWFWQIFYFDSDTIPIQD